MSIGAGVSVLQSNGVKIYDLSVGKSLPMFLEEAKKEKTRVKKLKEFRNRVELIQDFEFQTVCNRVRVSPDSKYIITAGIYPPSVKIFDTSELSLKCERGIDSEVVQMQVLSDDFSKFALLCDDRNIEIHAQYGKHYKLRIPKFGRDLLYLPYSADLVAASSSHEIYRLNLELGRFLAPLESQADSVNVLAYAKQVGLLAAGTELGTVEFWDYKSRKIAATIPAPNLFSEMQGIGEVTAVEFLNDGLVVGIGSQSGRVLMYDIRYPLPLATMQFQYRKPIKCIKHDPLTRKLFIADKKILKIYDERTYELECFIEPRHEINEVEICRGTGLLLMALENTKIGAYFVPTLGLAPKWCAFLDNMTEELEETVNDTVYENFKFLSKPDLEELNASHLIGTSILKAHLSGFLMEYKHYEALRSVMGPNALEERKTKAQAEFEKLSKDRILLQKVMPKVNQSYAKHLLSRTEVNPKKKGMERILDDSRFGKMFTEKDYTINTNSVEYLRSHPDSRAPKREAKIMAEEVEEVDDRVMLRPGSEVAGPRRTIRKMKGREGTQKQHKRVIIPMSKLNKV